MAKVIRRKRHPKNRLKNKSTAPELEAGRRLPYDGSKGQSSPPIALGFKVGQSPLPNSVTGKTGRPPGASLTHHLKRALNECNEQGMSFGEELMRMGVEAARMGNFKFFKEIFERVEGKVPENILASISGHHTIVRKGEKTPVRLRLGLEDDSSIEEN